MNSHVKVQILLLCCCQLIIIAAVEMSNTFLPIYLESLSDFDLLPVNAWNVLAYVMPLISAMLFSTFWGKYADRFGYKTMILRAALALATITDISNKQCFVVYNLKLYPRSYSRVFISSVSKEFISRILA